MLCLYVEMLKTHMFSSLLKNIYKGAKYRATVIAGELRKVTLDLHV